MRVDAVTGTVVQVTASRQGRPNLPADGCPFCVGGIESPEPYVVRSFPNRWPSFPDGRCEVVLYGPEHGETLADLGAERARSVVDLWAERTATLGGRNDVAYVLCFENHGAEVGATIDHPHGQLFSLWRRAAGPRRRPRPARSWCPAARARRRTGRHRTARLAGMGALGVGVPASRPGRAGRAGARPAVARRRRPRRSRHGARRHPGSVPAGVRTVDAVLVLVGAAADRWW